MKPLLAGEVTQPGALTYPILASPKLDGIRALVVDGELVSRTLKPIPNHHIRTLLSRTAFNGIDGEIIAGDTFQKTTSAVMSRDGQPAFTFFAFDDFSDPALPFAQRLTALRERACAINGWITLVPVVECGSWSDVEAAHARNLREGFEGTMLRSPDGHYKFGRSTEREGILLKLKDFRDDEAEVIGFEELMRNLNTATTDALGKTKRGHSKSGLVPGGTLGALVVRHPTFGTFSIGSGLDTALRGAIWEDREAYLGRLVKFRYQPEGSKDKPRIPTFLGFRDPIDI